MQKYTFFCIYANKIVPLRKFSTLYRMKQLFKYAFTIAMFTLCSMSSWAIAPLPGLNLTEPIREPIPHGVVSQQRAKRIVESQTQVTELVSRGLLIVVEFADLHLKESNTIHSFDSLANADEYTYNGATGSCKQYYQDQSNGKYTPHFDVIGPVVLPQTQAFYGTDAVGVSGDDQYIADFVIDACKGAQQLGVNFANYDQDNDGNVDLVYILYAGHGQADGGASTCIWPHAWDMQSALYFGNTKQTEFFVKTNSMGQIISQNLPVLDGKTILRYACSNELVYRSNARTSIGTICHEFGHVLGLADLYRTDGTDSKEVPGSWALMSNGNYLNNGNTPPNLSVWEKYFLGWVEPDMLVKNGAINLPADGKTYKMLNRTSIVPNEGALSTDTIYYFENRQKSGWDTYLPGWGMLVWRVVYDADEWYYNTPNNTTTRFMLVTANGSTPYTNNLSGGKRQDVPFPGSWEVTEYQPYSHTLLTNIAEEDGIITFLFTNTASSIDNPTIDKISGDGEWYNLLGQPIDIRNHHGIAISKQGKIYLQ